MVGDLDKNLTLWWSQFFGIGINVVLKNKIVGSGSLTVGSATFVSRASGFCFLNIFFTTNHYLPTLCLYLTPFDAWNPEFLQALFLTLPKILLLEKAQLSVIYTSAWT